MGTTFFSCLQASWKGPKSATFLPCILKLRKRPLCRKGCSVLRTCPHRGREKNCCTISERSDPPVFVAGKSPPFLDDFSIATFDPGKWNGVPWFWRWRFPQLFRPNGRNKSVERGMMGLLVGGDWNMFYDFPETVGNNELLSPSFFG